MLNRAGDGWIVCIFTSSILSMAGLVLELMFIRVFNALKLPAVCIVFFQQNEFGLCLCTLQGDTGAAVPHPQGLVIVTLSPHVFWCNCWGSHTGSESRDPTQIKLIPFLFFFDMYVCGDFVCALVHCCVLWTGRGGGKEAGTLYSRVIASAPTSSNRRIKFDLVMLIIWMAWEKMCH